MKKFFIRLWSIIKAFLGISSVDVGTARRLFPLPSSLPSGFTPVRGAYYLFDGKRYIRCSLPSTASRLFYVA